MAAQQQLQEKLEEELTCSICREILEDPKCPPCNHSFCSKCILHVYETSGDKDKKKLNCPECKEQFNISKLRSSFHLNTLMEILRLMITKKKEEELTDLCECESCEKYTVLLAFCPQCDGMICDDCFQRHKSMKALKDHQPTSLDKTGKENVDFFVKNRLLCTEKGHEKNKLEYYCREETCRRCICEDCVMSPSHENHRMQVVEEVAEEVKRTIQQHMDRVQQMKGKFQEELAKCKQNIETVKYESDLAKNEVHGSVQSILTMATNHEKSIIKILDDIIHSHKQANDTHQTSINEGIKYFSEFYSWCQNLLDASMVYISENEDVLQQKYQDLLKNTSTLSGKQIQPSVTVHYVTNHQAMESLQDLGNILETSEPVEKENGEYGESIMLDVLGGLHNFSQLGVELQYPAKAVSCPTKVTCRKLSKHFHPAPAEDTETLVSYILKLGPSSVELQEPILVSLMHSGPGKKDGYETIVKSFSYEKHAWENIQELDKGKFRKDNETEHIQVEISTLTTLAVVSRLIADKFEVTQKRCEVRSSVCNDVTVEFPEGCVSGTVNGTMKLLPMPDILDIGMTAYPGPIISIDGFKDIHFKQPVKIRLKHPHPEGYPSGQVRIFCMEDTKDSSHKWKDVTEQVRCVEHDSFIELNVDHFTVFWPWIYSVPIILVAPLYLYLLSAPENVCFGVFKGSQACSTEALTVTLVCFSNYNNLDVTDKLKNLGFTRLTSATAKKRMRPNDKAYTKIEGFMKKVTTEDVFLKFLKNEVYFQDLVICRKPKDEDVEEVQESPDELVEHLDLYFLRNKNDDVKHNLCKLTIEKNRIFPSEETSSSPVPVRYVGLESVTPSPSDSQSQEVIAFVEKQDIWLQLTSKTATQMIVDHLKMPERLSMEKPSPEKMKQFRQICQICLTKGKQDIVKELRSLVQSGTTGPLVLENTHYQNMEFTARQNFTRYLSGQDLWKKLAEKLKIPSSQFDFFAKMDNSAESILKEVCERRMLTVGELYNILCSIDAKGVADTYL